MNQRFILHTILCLLFLSSFSHAQTQEIKFTNIPGMNGIFLGKINSITQDKNGVMWFSDQTNRGITKYDGTRMIRYQNDPKKTNSLGGIYPECLTADSSGLIWIGFYGFGLDRFDTEKNIFTHYRHDPKDPQSLANDTITVVLIDHLKNIWIATYGGLDLLDPATGHFKHYSYNAADPTSLSNNKIRAIYEDHEGTIWVGCGLAWDLNDEGGLNRFDRNTGTFTRYLHDPKNPNSLISNKVRALFEDSYGTFWVGTLGDGLHSLDRKSGVITRHPYDPKHPEKLSRPPVLDEFDHITFITEDVERCLWIGTLSNGLCRYNPKTKSTNYFLGTHDNNSGFKDTTGWVAYTSPDGWLWISTQEASLYLVDLFTNKIFTNNSLGLGIFGFYAESADVVWIGTTKGLFRKDLKKGQTNQYQHDPSVPGSLGSNLIYDIFQDHEGIFWLSTPQGLIRFDKKSASSTTYRYNPNDDSSISWDDISEVYEDSDSKLFVCTYGGGINLMDTEHGTFTHYVHDEEDSTSLSSNIVTCIVEDETKDYWIGTWTGGINKMDRKTKRCKQYLGESTIIRILKDENQTIWAGGINGLYRYNRLSDAFEPFEIGGVPLTYTDLKSFFLGKDGNLWIAASSGLYRVNPKNDQCIVYGKENGIVMDDFYYNSSCVLEDGQILVGSGHGFYQFYPNKLTIPVAKPHIVFNSFFLKGQLVTPGAGSSLTDVIANTKEIILGHDQNVFSFGFTGIDYSTVASKANYYKLENYDAEWRLAGSEGQVYYFNIPPGKYKLHIKAINSSYGSFDEKIIGITITPPWYGTWWAYILYVIGAIGIGLLIHHYLKARVLKAERERNRAHELAQAKEIEKAYHALKSTQAQLIQSEKMASLGELTAGIAHEIQNPLNFINNFADVNAELIDELNQSIDAGDLPEVKNIAHNIKDNEQKIIFHGKRADGIVKGMLQHSRSSTGIKEPTDINALADEYLRLAYHGLRAKDKTFNAAMKTDFDPNMSLVNVVPQDMGRVILNLITNAFYAVTDKKKQMPVGYEPTVSVATRMIKSSSGNGAGGMVEIRVRDNGNGMTQQTLDKIFQPFFTTKPSGQGTGLGLSMSYDIITNAHNGELKVETKEGEFAEFIISLPL